MKLTIHYFQATSPVASLFVAPQYNHTVNGMYLASVDIHRSLLFYVNFSSESTVVSWPRHYPTSSRCSWQLEL